MLNRLLKPVRRLLPVAAFVLVVIGGLALALVPHAAPSAHTVLPQSSPSTTGIGVTPSRSDLATSTSSAVAGAATAAGQSAAPSAQPPAAATPPPAPATAAGWTCPAVTGPAVTVTVKYSGAEHTCRFAYTTGADPCTIMPAALATGFIHSLTLYDSTAYKASHYNSAYLYEMNGLKDGWGYKIFNSAGQRLAAPGCSLTPLEAGGTVIWSYGGE